MPTSVPAMSEKAATSKYERWNAACLDTWMLEILAVVFSTVCFIAMCILLIVYDDKAQPDLRYSLTLNAIISILATGCKSSLLFAIGEALSQSKWSWFSGSPRSLGDMQTFDSASRGPLGSIMLLFRGRKSIANIGAAIIVILLVFDPFVQQIIKYSTRLAPITDGSGIASTKRLRYFTPNAAPPEFNIAWGSGVWSEDNLFQPECSSGNCTWPIFRSVGVCSKCADITKSVSLSCQKSPRQNESFWNALEQRMGAHYFNASCQIIPSLGKSSISTSSFVIPYPNKTESLGGPNTGYDQNITWPLYTWYNNTSFQEVLHGDFDNYTFAGIHNPLIAFAFAKLEYDARFFNSSNPPNGFKVEMATECSLSLCLSDWEVSVQKNVPQIKTSNIDYGHSFVKNNITHGSETNFLCWRPTSISPNIVFQPDFSKSPDDFTYCGITGVTDLPQDMLKGSSPVSYDWFDGEGSLSYQVMNTGAASTQRISNAGLEHIMSNIANSLNKMVLKNDGEGINGTAHGIEVYIVVEWPWLILPGLLVILGTFFFFFAMVSNKKTVLWKSSVFAFLYHGLVPVDTINNGMTASGMEKEAMGECVQLRSSNDKGDLNLQK